MIKAIREIELSLKRLKGRHALFSLTPNQARAIRRQARKWPRSPGRIAGMNVSGAEDVLHDMEDMRDIVRAAKAAE